MEQGKIERLREKAKYFLFNEIKAFIKDKDNNYYFCDILSLGETHLFLSNFAGNRSGTKSQLLWIDIELISEYQELRE